MQHRKSLSILLLSFVLMGTVSAQTFQPYKSSVIPYHGYSFPIVPGTEAWKNIGYPQRVASLQLPADAALLATDTQAAQIATMLYKKKEQKTQYDVYGSTNRMVIALAIGRCLLRVNAFTDYQGTTLEDFLQNGKLANTLDLDYIFDKARTL